MSGAPSEIKQLRRAGQEIRTVEVTTRLTSRVRTMYLTYTLINLWFNTDGYRPVERDVRRPVGPDPPGHPGPARSGGSSVTEFAEPFAMSMPAVSKHLRVLERAGLIARGREAQWRPCRLEAAPLKEVAEWTERFGHLGAAVRPSRHLPAGTETEGEETWP